jgi:Glycosyl hydrolase family 12
MRMSTFENATYPSNFTAPPFSITWEYPFHVANASSPANESKPLIHAFPQAAINGGVLPIALEDLGELKLDFNWTMGPGSHEVSATSLLPLGAHQVNASVALDMYLDKNETKAALAGEATYEMIIYFAKFGLQDPVGFGNGSTIVMTQTVDGTD